MVSSVPVKPLLASTYPGYDGAARHRIFTASNLTFAYHISEWPRFSAQELAVSSFGEGLKRERDKKKITLDQVAVSTKISVRMLRAIEDEKFDQLPGGIFNKGFVRAYARHLGMDDEKAVADYLVASSPVAQGAPEDLELRAMAEQKQKERQRQASLKKDFPWGTVAAVLLLVALGFSIWGVMSGRESQSGKANIESLATPSPKVQSNPAIATPAAAASTTAIVNAKPLTPEVKADTSEDGSEMEVTTRHFPEGVPVKPVGPPATKAGSFTLLVTAQENSWLSIKADGKTIFTGTLIAPGVQLVHATDSIELRAGNLGGLEIDFNGKRLPPQGVSGQARTLTFRSNGLEPAKPSGSPETTLSPPTESSQNRD
jgi:cytoskeleton protein RodZ